MCKSFSPYFSIYIKLQVLNKSNVAYFFRSDLKIATLLTSEVKLEFKSILRTKNETENGGSDVWTKGPFWYPTA